MKRIGGMVLAGAWLAAGSIGAAEEAAATPAAPAPDWQAQAAAATRRGLDWLQANQRADGSWSNTNFPALTALPLWAFALSEHPGRAAVCDKAAAFVAAHVQPDGGIYRPATSGRGSGGLATYNTAVCMVALYHYDAARFREAILNARKFVASSQIEGDSAAAGGFGYNPPEGGRGGRADLSNTAWALRAMRETQAVEDLRPGEKVDLDWAATLKFVARLQNRSDDTADHYGGFGYRDGDGTFLTKLGIVRLRSFGSMTYAGLESLIYAQVERDDPRVRSAVEWAARHWTLEENPGMGSRGLFYYYNIMAKCLSVHGGNGLRDSDGKPIPWRQQLVAKLAALQAADGSWANRNNYFWEGDPALVTAYTLLAIEYAARAGAAPAI